MSAPPPPTGPPAGWYPDPDGGSGYRWWDGTGWTEAVGGPAPTSAPGTPGSGGPAGPAGPGPDAGSSHAPGPGVPPLPPPPPGVVDRDHGPIGPVDRLLGEAFRLTTARAGHLLPFVLLFMLGIGLISSTALWYGLRDTVLTIDEELATVEVDYGGSAGAFVTYVLLIPVSLLGAAIVRVAATRQAWLAQAGTGETWSQTLAAIGRRFRPVLGGTVARWIVYLVLGGGFLFVAALVPPFILAFPFVAIALVLTWIRLSFVDQAAILGPAGVRPLRTSYRTSGRQTGRLFLRLVVLALLALAVILVISLTGSLVTAIAGAEGTTPLDPNDSVIAVNDVLGENLALFVLSAAFGSLALGAATALVAVGTTLLYRNLDGPTGLSAVPDGDVEDLGPLDRTSTAPIDESAWP